jgi:hypothetical protein
METEAQNTNTEVLASNIWAGGLLAVSLVILQCFLPLNRSDVDLASLVSVCSLALAIPILTYKIVINTLRERKHKVRVTSAHQHNRTPYPELLFFIIGVLSVLIGTTAAFFHIHWIAAIIFAVCTIVGLIAYFVQAAAHF